MAAPVPASQQQMRQHNLSLLLRTLAEEGPASRASLAARTGLTRAGVSTLAEELTRAGLLEELGRDRPGKVGRPGSAVDLVGNGPCGVGAEVGVDRLAVCVLDLRGRVRVRREEASANRGSEPGPVLRRLREAVEDAAEEARGAGLRPAGLAVAVPALVRRGTGTVVHAPNLGWRDVDLAGHLRPAGGRTGRPGKAPDDGPEDGPGNGPDGTLPLIVDNEANFGALAHLWNSGGDARRNGAEPPPRDFLHVSAAAGIGGAVVQDGELVRGTRGFAGELGHVPVRPSGRRCACGGRGCLEQYAGVPALLRAAGLPGTRTGTDSGGEALERLARRAREGDAPTRRALATAGRAFGIALAGAVNLLDPGAIVLGGSLVPLADWLLPSLQGELGQRTAAPTEAPPVLPSPLGTDGPLLGAAHRVVRAVLAAPLARAGRR